MATYECGRCGMAVNATCAKCNEPLINDTISAVGGETIQVSRCPKCEGKIKSPMCCGLDMVSSFCSATLRAGGS
jgi:DNA-directed RNA polymerase subunit RPC12/RpoP